MSAAVALILPELLQSLRRKLPASVKELRADEGVDASGDPVLWVWPIVEDKHFNAKLTQELDDDIFEALMGKGPWNWVLVSPRTVTDQLDLDRDEGAEEVEAFGGPELVPALKA